MAAKKPEGQPILVPVDFSPHSKAALVFASELAAALHAPLTVLHVVHDPGEAPGFYAGKRDIKEVRKMEDVAAEMMEDFMKEVMEKYPDSKTLKCAGRMLTVGLPVNRILEVAKNRNARMVVMGSQGRTGLAHMLLGSKSQRVTHLCPVPVTIVKNGIE